MNSPTTMEPFAQLARWMKRWLSGVEAFQMFAQKDEDEEEEKEDPSIVSSLIPQALLLKDCGRKVIVTGKRETVAV